MKATNTGGPTSHAGHTPGPWFAADGGVIWHETVVGAYHPECCGDFRPNGECCGLSVRGYHEELAQEQIATCSPDDADLIAAAPELYEAARLAVEYDKLLREYEGPVEVLTAGDNAKIDAAYDAWRDASIAALAKARGNQ